MKSYPIFGFTLQLLRTVLSIALVTAVAGTISPLASTAAIIFGSGALLVPMLWALQLFFPNLAEPYSIALRAAKTIELGASLTALWAGYALGFLGGRLAGLVILIATADVTLVMYLLLWTRRAAPRALRED